MPRKSSNSFIHKFISSMVVYRRKQPELPIPNFTAPTTSALCMPYDHQRIRWGHSILGKGFEWERHPAGHLVRLQVQPGVKRLRDPLSTGQLQIVRALLCVNTWSPGSFEPGPTYRRNYDYSGSCCRYMYTFIVICIEFSGYAQHRTQPSGSTTTLQLSQNQEQSWIMYRIIVPQGAQPELLSKLWRRLWLGIEFRHIRPQPAEIGYQILQRGHDVFFNSSSGRDPMASVTGTSVEKGYDISWPAHGSTMQLPTISLHTWVIFLVDMG